MKRYWRLIAIVAVVVLTIGTFYIQSSFAAGDLPEITVKTMNGDADELNPMTVEGRYETEGQFLNVNVDETGATYDSEQSLFKRLSDTAAQERIQELQEEHRGFMRGKSGNAVNYLETEEALAYADVTNQRVSHEDEATFDMAVLTKESGETTSFTVPVPDGNMYNLLFVEDVQMSGDELVIVTHNSTKDGKEEEHVYRVNTKEQTIKSDEMISSNDHTKADKGNKNVSIQTSDDKTALREEILFRKMRQVPVSKDEQDKIQGQQYKRETKTKTDGYIEYQLDTGKTRNLDIPETLMDQTPVGRDDAMVYFKKGAQMTAYHFKDDKTRKLDLPAYTEVDGESILTKIKNDKAYLLTRNQEAPQRLLVLDLASGDTLYEGRLIFDDVKDNASLELTNLMID